MAFNWNKKLSDKVMVLLFVPLSFEVLLMATLYFLLHQAESDTAKAEKSRVVIATAEHMGKLLYDSGLDLQIYLQTRDSKWANRYLGVTEQMRATAAQIKQLVAGIPQEEDSAERLEKATFSHLRSLRQIKRYIDLDDMFRVMSISTRIAQQGKGLFSMANEIEAIIAYEDKHKVSPEKAAASRRLVTVFLVAGLLASIAIAAGLAIIFVRGTTNRLAILMDNTQRLTRKEPLNPVVSGADEISELDQVFHDMAVSVEEASRKERAVVENAVDVICSIGADGRFTRVNTAALRSWGYAPDYLLGKPFLDIVLKEDREKSKSSIEEITKAQNDGTFENRINCRNGAVVDILWSAHWSSSEQSLFCVAHDITYRKQMERLKQEFVAMVSHDLRTPLTSIKGTLQLLSNGTYGALSGTAQTRVEAACQDSDRLIRLINDILDIERMESGSLQLQKEVALASRLIERSVDAVRSIAEQRRLKIVTSGPEAELVVDEDRIIQVLVNLLANAAKFAPEGSDIIVATDSDDTWVKVSVTDSGRGVPPELQQAIFERFKQVKESDGRDLGGTGLGLAICKAIIEAHGGKIGVDSQDGHGSSFWIQLPA